MTRATSVLVVGPSAIGDMAWFTANAARSLGLRVSQFDSRKIVRAGLTGYPGRAMERVGVVPRLVTPLVQRGFGRKAAQADVVVVIRGEHLDPEVVHEVAAQRPVVNWYSDHPVFDKVFDSIGAYTLFCPKDEWSVGRLADMGFANVRLLRHASDPSVLAPTEAEAPRFDLSVVGTLYPYRAEWIERAEAAGASVGLWGERHWSARRTRVAASAHPPAVGPAQGRALRSGRCTLNTHAPKDIGGGNKRLFDAAAAGVAQITEHLASSVDAFDPSEEILTYGSGSEFDHLMKLLKANEIDGHAIARRALERVRAEHTYEHRLGELLPLVT